MEPTTNEFIFLIGIVMGGMIASVGWIAWMFYACSPKRDMRSGSSKHESGIDD